jgi:endonuclease-3
MSMGVSSPMKSYKIGKLKIGKLINKVLEVYPDEKLDLKFSSPFELLVAAILAAQSKDEVVNQATEKLFQVYKTPEDFSKLKPEDLEPFISRINYWYKKAQTIIDASKFLLESYGGKVPDSKDELLKIKGVGSKTANMILGGAFGKPAVVVDTHVDRVSKRLGLVSEKAKPDEVEAEIKKIVPEKDWTRFSFALMRHGKKICHAKNPECESCPFSDLCEYFNSR